jgi:FdhD protein
MMHKISTDSLCDMEIVPLGKTLEIAKEKMVTLVIGDTRVNIACTPENLRELAIGFLTSEGLVTGHKICVKVDGDVINVENLDLGCETTTVAFKLRSSGSPGVFRSSEKLPVISASEIFNIAECRNALEFLDIEAYRRTRGYHIAALVGKNGLISRAYDVGRHNAVDKVIGMGVSQNIDFSQVFLLVSGRVSDGIVAKCVRCGIPLLVSKAAILDSAIRKCMQTGLSVASFASGIAVKGDALIM